jgi:hypothetical protein
MGYVAALLLLIGGVISIAAYNGTPDFSAASCGPIQLFSYSFVVDVDCLTMRTGELIAAFACFLLAIFAMFNARSRGPHRRW